MLHGLKLRTTRGWLEIITLRSSVKLVGRTVYTQGGVPSVAQCLERVYTHIIRIAYDADLVSYMDHAPFLGVQALWECCAPLCRCPEEIRSVARDVNVCVVRL